MNPINSEWPFFCSYFCQVLGLDGVHWQGTVYSALPGQRRDNTKLLVYYITKSLFTLYAKFDTLKFHQLGVLITWCNIIVYYITNETFRGHTFLAISQAWFIQSLQGISTTGVETYFSIQQYALILTFGFFAGFVLQCLFRYWPWISKWPHFFPIFTILGFLKSVLLDAW